MNLRERESRTKRRAVSGILAALLLFSMLFSVGTGFFLFVSSGESQYSHALSNRAANLQSQLGESLTIIPASGGNNHLVFTATNGGGLAANITDVFVVDPGGVTHAYGVGFVASNTTPALPGGVTPQKTSASYDTGLTIVAGTYAMKVITHRGNAYTATYPPAPTNFASSTGSLTVDLSSFKWVQLTGTSSITQQNYVPNCNAALCAAKFTSSVTSGDTLVYAVGWPTHAPPATPTDTRGDTFTLGASNTVSTASGTPPTLVQNRYASNCASSSCGLGFTSNVATGNTLAFALGWVNQGPPSTPTDTLGNTYTLGVSNSLTSTAPTLVQKNYNSNCASSSCGLAFTSSVTAGDTLAFALGWANQSPPSTPTDTRGDTFTLGVSNSASISSGTAPTLVQKNYAANCNSASCGLAFTSNVVSGNTLVFGLGWFGLTQYYVPITITNSQGSATPTTFQEKVTWNPSTYSAYEASDLGNIRFCADAACATILYAWLESCTASCIPSATSASAWVKLTSSIAGSGGTQTVYMSFLATSITFDGNYWGEAPTIPGTYGTNDNGANVFTFYDNFAGTTLSNKWTTAASTGASTIALDATSSSAAGLGAVSSFSWTHTVGTGLSNSILIVGVDVEKSSGFDASTVTYNSVSMTKKIGVGGSGQTKASLWYLLNPPSGAHTVLVTLSGTVGTDGAAGGAVSLSGVDQTTPLPTTNTRVGTGTPSQSITTVNANSWTVDSMAFDSANVQSATGSGQTRRWGVAASGMSSQGSTIATTTAGSYTMSWSGSDNYAMVIAEVKPSAVGSATCTVTVNNGATFTTSSSSGWCFVAATQAAYPSVAESYMVSSGSVNPMLGVSTSYSANAAGLGNGLYSGYTVFWNSGTNTRFGQEKSTGYTNLQSTAQTTFPAGIWQVIWSATGSEYFQDGAGHTYSGSDSGVAIANYGIYVGQSTLAIGSNVVDWGRMRAYPPGNVMPSTSFGSVAAGDSAPSSVTDTRGSSFTLGISKTVTGASYIYYSFIWYATAASSGADTITATFPLVATGSVSVYEISGASTASPSSSTGSSSGGSTTPAVASFTPSSNSFVIGNTETSSSTSSFTAGGGYTLSGTCASVYGCGEYQTGVSSATTVPFTLGVAAPWAESAISFAPATVVYYSYIWYAAAVSSGADTITASFSSSVTGSVSVYEISVNANPSIASSSGSSSTGSTTPSVASFTPVATSIVIGNTETNSATSSFTAGGGFTLGGTCSSVYGCGEYQTGVSSATTAPFTLGVSAPWVESAISFGPSAYYSYIWYATTGSSGADTITASFGSAAIGSVSIFEISGATTAGPLTSTGSSSGGSTTPAVTSFTPAAGSFVIGNTETSSSTSSFTAGGGYTLSGTCSSVYGCGEYQTGVSSATTVPFTLGVSASWVDSAISFSPSPTVFYSYIWYATAVSSGPDTITASFSSAVVGTVSIYDMAGYTTAGLLTSYGSSSAGSNIASVTSFTPSANSIVIGNVETSSSSTSYTPGVGYSLVNKFNCNPGYGCGEYHAGLGFTTTAPFTLSSSAPWVESAISFASSSTYQSGVSQGGYPSVGVPNDVSIVFRMTFTNQDAQGRSITLWPQSALAVSAVKCSGEEHEGSCGGDEEDATNINPYYIIDGINVGVNGIIAYNSTQNFVTLAPGVKTTLYFGARTPLASQTNSIEEDLQSLFMAFFALTGQYSDKSLYGQTIPYPVGIVTAAAASTSINTGATGAVVTVTGDDFNNNKRAFIGWMDSTGKITTLVKFTTSSDDIPAGTTFQVPSASAGFYTIIVSDYSNTVFMTFQHT